MTAPNLFPVQAPSFSRRNPPYTGEQNARFQILRSTTPEEWKAIFQCCHHLSLAAHATPFDAHELKRLQYCVATHLLSHPQLATKMAFAIGLTRQAGANPPPLETQFAAESTSIDLHNRPNFNSYLDPNECEPLRVVPHLVMTRPGLIVSAGTERSFFDLALSDPTKCEGLVVRDFNPEVKAYVDFNVLLLRIAENREDYVRLSTLPPHQNIDQPLQSEIKQQQQKIQEIRCITERANLAPHIKAYYLKHLDALGTIYFNTARNGWKIDGLIEGVRYYEDDRLFNQLQQYAKSGNIIATVGDISDLEFLDKRNIEILDTSNIPDYFVLNFKTKSRPRIISTKVVPPTYRSSIYSKPTNEQVRKLSHLLSIFNTQFDTPTPGRVLNGLITATNQNDPRFKDPSLWFYSKNLLDVLRERHNQYCIWDGDQWIDFGPGSLLNMRLGFLPVSKIEQFPRGFEKADQHEIILLQFLILANKKIDHLPQDKLLAVTKLRSWPAARYAYNRSRAHSAQQSLLR